MDYAQTFRVVLTGGYIGGTEPAEAHKLLAALTGSKVQQVTRLMERLPAVVKRGLDEETAHRYLFAIKRTGVACRLEPEFAEGILRRCPKCGDEQPEWREDCSACGIVFHKYSPSPELEVTDEQGVEHETVDYAVRAVPKEGGMALIIGMAAAGIVLMLPLISFVFSAFSTLVHEFGHSLIAWIFGYPSLPAFDFVYGGGVALHFAREEWLLWLIYGAFLWLVLRYVRRPLTLVVLLGAIAVYSLLAFTSAHRLLGIFMGHGMELVISALFLFRALSGHATFHGLERVLYGFVGFFLQFRALQFVYEFFTDPGFREFYRLGKRGITNDFQRIAWMLNVELPSVFGFFLVCALLPPLIAWLAYRYEPMWFTPLRRLFAKE